MFSHHPLLYDDQQIVRGKALLCDTIWGMRIQIAHWKIAVKKNDSLSWKPEKSNKAYKLIVVLYRYHVAIM